MQRSHIFGHGNSLAVDIARFFTLFFIFLLPWENVIILPGLGTLARLVGIAMAGSWLVAVAVTGRIRKPHPVHLMTFALLAWAGATIIWSPSLFVSGVFMSTLIQIALLMLISWDLLSTKRLADLAVRLFVAGALVSAGLIIVNGALGNVTTFERRATIANSNSNDIGVILALSLPLAWHHAMTTRTIWRPLCFAFIPAAYIAIFFTASRSSLLATLPFIIYLLALIRRSSIRQRMRYVVGGAMALPFIFAFAPESGFERFSTIGDSVSEGEFGSRQIFWARGLELWLEDPWSLLLGGGIGTFAFHIGRVAHQTFISVAFEVGVIGLGLFIATLVVGGREIRRLPIGERWAWTASFGTWFIGVQTLSWEFHKVTWMILIMAVISACASRRRPTNEEATRLVDRRLTGPRNLHSSPSP